MSTKYFYPSIYIIITTYYLAHNTFVYECNRQISVLRRISSLTEI